MKRLIPLLFLVVAATAASQFGPQQMTPDQKLRYAERVIEAYYVDSVNTDRMVQDAIVAMLKTLDPHSTYSDPEETKELTTPLEGNFSGIGIQFNMLNDTLFVIQTTAGGPSEKVGILPGDRILTADGEPISGVKKPNSEVIKKLRGPKGTTVAVEVQRRGVDRPIEFLIVRDDIPINSVDAAYMADERTGYIRLTRFAEESNREFVEALRKLQRQGMENLIIDLEDNGGGYLGSAFEIASNFLRRGDVVVYTDAPKLGRTVYDVERDGSLRDGRLVVMVNQYSASASEILSGAIQDYDRGLVVGRRTFGKGLVQRPFPFPDGSMIRLTVSRYYTPSGRSIQKPYEEGHADDYRQDLLNRYKAGEFSSADSIHMPDSLLYHTLRRGRPVYGGGGIMPDLFVPIDTTAYSDYYRDLVAKGVINRFCITYVDDHRAELRRQYPTEKAFIDDFTTSDELMEQLVALGAKDGVEMNEEQYAKSEAMMRIIVKAIIARDLFETESYLKVVNPALSPTYRAALDLINDEERYNSLLAAPQQRK